MTTETNGLLTGKKVFITGATGFVGSNLVRRSIEEGAELYANIRPSSDTWRIRDVIRDISPVYADLSGYEQLRNQMELIRPDIIFHTAVYGGNAAQTDVDKIFETNILGTANLLRSCQSIDYELFVNTGSSSEYGLKQVPMNERDLPEPVNDYGVSKAASSIYCRSMACRYNLPVVTLRLFSPYGPYEAGSRLIPSVIMNVLNGRKPQISSRNFVRDFIFIDDVLDAYMALVSSGNLQGKIYNVGSGLQHTVGDVLDTILRIAGTGGGCDLGKEQAWNNEPTFWQADISRIMTELDWKPRYTLEKGLNETLSWFKRHMSLYR